VIRRTSILLEGATPTHIIAYGAAPTATVEFMNGGIYEYYTFGDSESGK
jgi:hypothetical protein